MVNEQCSVHHALVVWYRGWNPTQLYWDYFITQYKDPFLTNQDSMECHWWVLFRGSNPKYPIINPSRISWNVTRGPCFVSWRLCLKAWFTVGKIIKIMLRDQIITWEDNILLNASKFSKLTYNYIGWLLYLFISPLNTVIMTQLILTSYQLPWGIKKEILLKSKHSLEV